MLEKQLSIYLDYDNCVDSVSNEVLTETDTESKKDTGFT